MPITSRSFLISTVALLLVGLTALVVIVGMTIWLVERSQSYFDQVIEARDARASAVNLRSSLNVAETSQRGFLLTGKVSYLDRYQPAHDAVPGELARFRELMEGIYGAGRVDRIADTVTDKVAEMDRTIELSRAGRTDEALALVETDQGRLLMNEATDFFTQAIAQADERLAAGVAAQRDSAVWLRWTSIVGGIVILLVVGGSTATAIRYTRETLFARDAVAELNRGLEQRVQERTADLEQANEEVQRFAYIVTHDLRAPLVNIMGFTSELESGVQSVQALVERAEGNDLVVESARVAAKEDLPEAIAFIRSSTNKMDGLINAILTLSREGKRVLKPERVDLNGLLQNAAAALQHQLSEADGHIDLSIDVPVISSDRLSLDQVFGNLLDNAIKYRARNRPLSIAIRATPAPLGRIAVEVQDNGRGIAETDRERVFELFRRSGAQDQAGEGIGLAYVRTVVRNLGGDITLESQINQGSTFRVILPRNLNTSRSQA